MPIELLPQWQRQHRRLNLLIDQRCIQRELRQRCLRVAVHPGAARKIEVVEPEEVMPLSCKEMDRFDDVIGLGVIHDPVQPYPAPPGL